VSLAVSDPAPGRALAAGVVPDLLREYGSATSAVVSRYLTSESPSPYLDPLIATYPLRPGKMMRSGICIATACAFGAQPKDAVGCAAAIELFHNALLVHDDIEDESEERRGRPTLHVEHGVPLAINAGDALMLLALRALADGLRGLDAEAARQAFARTQHMARQTAEGQALELGWRLENRPDITEADYLEMVLKKTAWMSTIWPSQMGVLIGARGTYEPANVVRFGFFLGAAFQIQDDLLNLVADPRYGKERYGDLYEGKRTLMIIHARKTCGASDRAMLDEFLGLKRQDRTPAMVEKVVRLMRRQGSIDHARAIAAGLAGAAAHEYELAYGRLPPSRDRSFLEGLVSWLFKRS
jgi:geranylgeranyl diphosphate synthase type II